MLLEIELIRAREFIRVGPRGHLDLEKSRRIIEKLVDACRKRGTGKALIDLRESCSNFGTEELAACLNIFGEIGSQFIRRVALLYRSDDRRRVRTLSMMASLRGWEVRAFPDFESAFEWLALSDGRKDRPSAGNRARTTTPGERIPIQQQRPSTREPKGRPAAPEVARRRAGQPQEP